MKIKALSALLCAVILLGLLAACGGGGGAYRDDVSIDTLAAAVDAKLSAPEAMIEAPGNYIIGTMQMDVSSYAGYSIKLNSMGINIDEYGIFKGTDEKQAQEIKKAVEDYLQLRRDSWMPEYMPQEYPKLENAEIRTAGNYVMYAILSDSEKTAVFAAFEQEIAK